MATTTNFGWETPDDTDLVKDGALAIRTLGSAIDTSLVDLKGGTTGQVLSKNSNTDMDFTWVAQDDSNAIQNAIVDAKGDLITATAADTPARLAVGTNGHVLTADSTTATGLKWAAAAGGGKVLQVVNANTSTSVQTFSTTYADSGLSASITPSATTSKVLIIISQNFWTGCNANAVYAYAQLLRGSTKIQEKWWGIEAARNGSSPLVQAMEVPLVWLDSPSTTSSTTYKTQFKLGQADVGGWGGYANYNSTNSSITLLEIGA